MRKTVFGKAGYEKVKNRNIFERVKKWRCERL